MEGRSWPWKRKSSDNNKTEKPVVGHESTNVCSLSYLASLENQEKCKNSNYVQISMESYTHMSKMEEQVELFEIEVKDLKEKLTIAHSEIKTKEGLILQHAKVAEEAVSGWEKADAETLSFKRQLKTVTRLKLTSENRASHLDDALKECTRQIRIVKEESEKKLQDQWDKNKAELERKIDELNQGLHRAASDTATLTRSLQERSAMIVRISEEKSKAEGEVEKLKTNVKLAEKEINSLKYDVHVASTEAEVRNEERNMSLKSAENANKQHLEGVKKIAKLEAECQRLRGLLRKKLPGPAAMAQMKIEVESLGNEFTDPRAHMLEECKREKRRVFEMEEEIQALKEQLAARNNELQVSRNVCGKTLNKLKILESVSSGNDNHSPPSATSVSEDGFDEEGSSSATSTDSHKVRKGSTKAQVSNKLELMDDFLEIEKLAANDPEEANSASKSSNSVCGSNSVDKHSATKSSEQDEDTSTLDQLLKVLRSRINRIFESQEGISVEKIVEAARFSFQDMQRSSSKQVSSCLLFEVADETLEKHVLSSQDTKNSGNVQKHNTTKQDLEAESNDKVTLLEKETKASDSDPLELDDTSCKSLLKELEQVKFEKEHVALELSRILQNLETTKAEMEEKEKLISKLTSSGTLQSLAETQLKCVTESYKSLELHSKNLEARVKSLEEETKRLEMAFSTEKQSHEETLAKCRDLQETMQRNETCIKCSSSKLQPNQEKDIATATEKLAACQETIHLLSQQLQSLQPQDNHITKSQSLGKNQHKTLEATQNSAIDDHIIQPSHSFRHTVNPTVHAIIKSNSVSSSSKEDNEKHTRGLGRFFSSKSKNNGR